MQKKSAMKNLIRLVGVVVVIGAAYYWISNIKPGPRYIQEAGMFMIPAGSQWTDDEIKAAVGRLLRERQLRVELAQLLEQNAGK